MGTLSNLFELVRDRSYQEIEEEVNREVAIALGGNSLEARDRLHKALSRPMESLWTANPFRLIETNEQPTADGETGGLLLYALYQNDRISKEKRQWLHEIAVSPNVSIIVAVMPRQKEEATVQERNLSRRLQAFNPLRLVGGNGTEPAIPTGAGADGASFGSSVAETRPIWEMELEELENESNGKLNVVRLSRLSLGSLERELLPLMVKRLQGRELALAKRAPVFRNSVANYFINNAARSNAELVLMANLTGGLPFIGDFFGGGADFVVLTKNQFELSHRLANVYGQKRNGWVELYLELAPIVAGALIWRSLSRTLTEKLPPLLATFPKGAVAYLATLSVGKIAQLYYASGRKGPNEVANFSRTLFEQVTGQRKSKEDKNNQNRPPRRIRSS